MSQLTMPEYHHVTAVITHRVKPGREKGYEAWMKGIAAAAREFEGHLGISILRPQPGTPPDYVIVLQFDECDRLQAWLQSEVRRDWFERAKPLIYPQENIQILTGLESWFQIPTQSASLTPKRYKQTILVWGAVMVVNLAVTPFVEPLWRSLPALLATALNSAVTVFLLIYLLLPNLTRWFKGWLLSN
jgi:hypothetical protein